MGKCQDLLDAARNGNINVVGKILEHYGKRGGPLSSFRRSPSINWQDVNGYTPLHHACLNGHLDIVRLLLSHDATTDIPDIRGSTPLYLASWAGHQEIVKMLLMSTHKPADPNAQTIENETALHCAAQHGHSVVVAILLAYGADPTIRNNSFQTALDLASQFGRLQVVQILIKTHPELIAPFRLYDEVVALENGHSPPYTITPTKHISTHSCLHLAARNGHKKLVETLLAAGVDVNILTHAGSALHEAALCGKKSVVCTLLRAGIDPYALDGNGRTALDILNEYPPHVTYEIVTIINDFCQESNKMNNKTHFMPIKDVNDNTNSIENEGQMEDDLQQQRDCLVTTPKEEIITNSLKRYNNSRERYNNNSGERYTPMEPIKWQTHSIEETKSYTIRTEYKPVYKTPSLLTRRLGEMEKNFPKLMKPQKIDSDASLQDSTGQYYCVDEYVEMSMPSKSACCSPITPTPTIVNQPLASPRLKMDYGDYANINTIKAQRKLHDSNNNNYKSQEVAISSSPETFATNNNKNKHSIPENDHSPTPDYPPPTPLQAETTIFEYVKPPEKNLKRQSLHLPEKQLEFYDGLKSFIWEGEDEPYDLEQPDSLSSSRVSECVEEFVGDKPFAGLFKGSSLNLALEPTAETNETTTTNTELESSSGLRSPSLVKSVKPPIPAKRTSKLLNAFETNGNHFEFNPSKKEKEVTEAATTANTDNFDDFDPSKVWDEINDIFENIGNEMSPAQKISDVNESQSEITNTLKKNHLKIRKPSELLLGSSSNKMIKDDQNSNWCHSSNTLIYGYVIYNVFYLGSTVIRELYGTASTRKSIQKFKRDETPAPQDIECEIIQDINCSTKILKETNQKTRLEVRIALSHAGVRFIDPENNGTICIHDIENINCVSQDSEDLRYFAYITREKDIHYCHVFMVDSVSLATEIILTLGQAFEVAYQLSLVNQEVYFNSAKESNGKRLSYIDIVDKI